MSTITAILEADEDGTLHLPVPESWRHLPIHVKAELEPTPLPVAEAYSEEWRATFGSISDDNFASPPRMETLDAGGALSKLS